MVGKANWREATTMPKQCCDEVEHREREQLLAELRRWERQLVLRSLDEAIRLIRSGKVEKLTGQHIHCIAEYDAITIDGEGFFDKAFTCGKEVAACLAFAMEIGWRDALDDMLRLRLTLVGAGADAGTGPLEGHEAGYAAVSARSPT